MINIRDIVKISPGLLTIAPTHKCTASCKNCCFGCNPSIEKVLSYKEIVKYIDEAIATYPSIKILVLTGGECFLLQDVLIKTIEYAKSKNLLTRVVTNAYWATTYENAVKRLEPIVRAGLT